MCTPWNTKRSSSSLKAQDALAAQDARPLLLHEILHPGKELVGSSGLSVLSADRLHLLVVIVLRAAAVHGRGRDDRAVIMVDGHDRDRGRDAVCLASRNSRLDLQDAVEIEGVAAQHLRQRDLAALGRVHLGVGIDAADARLDLASSSGVTRSVLLSRMTSAKAIWFLASGASLSRSCSHLASATVTTASSLVLRPTFSSMKKVCATGAGIGEPGGLDDDGVELALAPHQPVDDAHRSPRTVQQMQPLFISNTSSSAPDHQVVVDADLAELVDDDGVLLP
jgi:hypothetical protein